MFGHAAGRRLQPGRAGRKAVASKKIAEAPPMDWQVVTVDLWDLHKKPMRIQALSLSALGGGAAFDRILLARTAEDLK